MNKIKRMSYIYIYILIGLFSLFGVSVFASDSSVDTINVSVPESCTLSTPAGSGQTYNENILNGQYKNNIGKTRLNVFCNTKDSFAIYAVGYSNNTLGNTEMVVTNGNGAGLVTGTATSGDISNWAMKIESVAGTGANGSYTPTVLSPFNNFTNVPSTWAKVAEVASATNGTTVEGSVDASYAVYISPKQLSGSYTGKVRYTVVHPASEVPAQPVACSPGKICYVPNTATVVDTMSDQTETYDAINNTVIALQPGMGAELWASNFQHPGYGFAGWNTAYDYSGTTYGPNETITTPSDLATNGLTLYAVWVKSAGNIQNWQSCNSLTQGQVTALTDTRDNNTYAVAKLADGKCWMIENLRLGGTTPMTLTPANTNITSDFTLSAGPGASSWCSNPDAACTDQSLVNITSTTNPVANMTASLNQVVYSDGHFYNWYSAVAGTRSFDDGSGNATGSICPAGWKLPTGWVSGGTTDYGDFYRMVSAISGKTLDINNSEISWDDSSSDFPVVLASLKTYPNNFINSGIVGSSAVIARGIAGVYWSASAISSHLARQLSFDSNTVDPAVAGGSGRSSGFSIRCMVGS